MAGGRTGHRPPDPTLRSGRAAVAYGPDPGSAMPELPRSPARRHERHGMPGLIALEEHLSTPRNNELLDGNMLQH
ncbi:hypothetical protein Airi01_040590 [Actinoallomurus iriomotensis]|uniref:Uncharacterized protein n=1 Tax=Actinoallomurus iriomotensis TaxID=478107 RepID=A0A9W6RKP5_9ACTN|nr:hypothetical protein Airi01_040590 [Actinoallomurus iriomotensis]